MTNLGKQQLNGTYEITPKILELAELCEKNNNIERELYTKYDVKRGLRDLNGKGVLAGLTNISDVLAKKIVDGVEVPCEGNLYYRGYNIKELVKGFWMSKDLASRRLHICCCLENFRVKHSLQTSIRL